MLAETLRQARLQYHKKLSQRKLAEDFKMSNTAISNIENGQALPSDDLLKTYSDFFNIPLEELLIMKTKETIQKNVVKLSEIQKDRVELENLVPPELIVPIDIYEQFNPKNIFDVPLYSCISAGLPNMIEPQEPLKMIPFNSNGIKYSAPKNIMSIVVNGDSMNKIIPDNSHVYVDKGAKIKSNDIVAFNIDGSEFALKRLTIENDLYTLKPESFFDYPEISFNKDEAEIREFKIIGKVIDIQTKHLI